MDLLTPGVGLIFWQALIFLVLLFVLSKMAWKPLLNSLKEREETIQGSLDAADKARQQMASMQADSEALLKEAREERDKILRTAQEAANRMNEEARNDAKKSADKIIEDAKSVIQTEKQAALRDIKEQVALFSLEVAEKLMRKNLSDDKAQKELTNRFVDELKLN
ncbi:MAG TPA: ATP synthase F0 subunit B [Cytophagales bacterium]|nr:ATP synthase F0 subunit B [Cytophagales bacterium]HCR53199.1 ATP synthase F0 subunit B [Cytophagales bacterium]